MLTQRQHEALTLICERVAAKKPAPSFAELGRSLGTRSKSNVHRIVHGLIARGFLSHLPGFRRCLTPIKWPNGARFDPNNSARVEALIITYENGRQAGRNGRVGEPNPCCGEHATAWRLGHELGAAERRRVYPREPQPSLRHVALLSDSPSPPHAKGGMKER